MDIIINNNKYTVKPVITQKDISNGMMNKKFNNSFDGMLFIMEDGDHSFWMKNCIIPLDIIFIKNNQVTEIHHNCLPCKKEECERFEGYGDMILEIPAGHCEEYNIVEGNRITFHY
jgi:uncharacterized membrane protein (UPF0127 family)